MKIRKKEKYKTMLRIFSLFDIFTDKLVSFTDIIHSFNQIFNS